MEAMPQPQQTGRQISDPDRWKPGKYKAKAIVWSISKTKAGLPQVVILFEYQQGEESRQLMWFGSFKDKAKDRTLETLFNLGLRSAPSSLESGREGGELDVNQEVEIVVEHRIGQDGVRRAGIAWVNQKGRGLESKLAQGEAKALLASVDSEFMATLISKGEKPREKNLAQKLEQEQGMLGESDIPF